MVERRGGKSRSGRRKVKGRSPSRAGGATAGKGSPSAGTAARARKVPAARELEAVAGAGARPRAGVRAAAAAESKSRQPPAETLPAGKGKRIDGRRPAEMRPVNIIPNYSRYAEGSALIELGETRVLCSASVENGVPRFLRDTGRGWVTAEYGMLPRSTHTRTEREVSRGRVGGRTSEIQRLVGRSLRAVIDLDKLGERTIWVDCDVLQADGGTRTASITGGFLALCLAVDRLARSGDLDANPIREPVAAVSVGIVNGRAVADLCYEEDSAAEVDMNVVMTGSGRFVEVQGTAERNPFTVAQMARMTALAADRIADLCAIQRRILTEAGVTPPIRRKQ